MVGNEDGSGLSANREKKRIILKRSKNVSDHIS